MQTLDSLPSHPCVVAIGLGPIRINPNQRIGNSVHDSPGVFGVEPDMHIEFAVIMVVMVAILVMVIILGMSVMVIMLFVPTFGFMSIMIVMTIAMVLVMVVAFPDSALAIGQQMHSRHSAEGNDHRFGTEVGDWVDKKGLQVFANPNDQVCPGQSPRLGRAQLVGVGRRGTREKEFGVAGFAHHAGDKRVNRFDGCDNAQIVCA